MRRQRRKGRFPLSSGAEVDSLPALRLSPAQLSELFERREEIKR